MNCHQAIIDRCSARREDRMKVVRGGEYESTVRKYQGIVPTPALRRGGPPEIISVSGFTAALRTPGENHIEMTGVLLHMGRAMRTVDRIRPISERVADACVQEADL